MSLGDSEYPTRTLVGRLTLRRSYWFALASLMVGHVFGSIARVNADALPVSRGLIRWWPNPLDAQDEVTGTPGRVMGVLDATTEEPGDAAWFAVDAAWAELEPAITNQVFTLAFWVHPLEKDSWVLVSQETQDQLWRWSSGSTPARGTVTDGRLRTADAQEDVPLESGKWQHVAICQRADETSSIWVDGVLRLDGRVAVPWPRNSRSLTVGRDPGGGAPFLGGLTDLVVFDRELSPEELASLHQGGWQPRPPKMTSARAAAQPRLVPSRERGEIPKPSAPQWTERQIAVDDRLPGSVVTALFRAKDGFLWVGTDVGLYRFDGLDPAATTSKGPPLGSAVFCITETPEGTIWAGTFGTLFRVRGMEANVLTNGPSGRYISLLRPGSGQSLWMASRRAEVPRGAFVLQEFDPLTCTYGSQVSIPGHPRQWEITDSGHWLATESPALLLHWDGQSPRVRIVAEISANPHRVQFAEVPELPAQVSLHQWRSGDDVWWEIQLGASGPRMRWLCGAEGAAVGLSGSAERDSPVEWLAAAHELVRIRDRQWEIPLRSERSQQVSIEALVGTDEGGVWWGTQGDGSYHLAEKPVRVIGRKDGLAGNNVRSVTVSDDGAIWVASSEGLNRGSEAGWSHIDPERTRYSVVSAVPGAGNWHSFFTHAPTAVSYRFPSGHESFLTVDGIVWNEPNCLRTDRSGRVWISCQYGVSCIDIPALGWQLNLREGGMPLGIDARQKETSFRRFRPGIELPKAQPMGLIEDADGAMWVGSLGGGLSCIRGNEVRTFATTNGFPPVCAPVLLDAQGSLWLATSLGLGRRTAVGEFQLLNQSGGWPDDTPLDAIEDGLGYLWVSGRRGIHRFSLSQLEEYFAGRRSTVVCITLGRRDGLSTPACSALRYPTMAKGPDGRLWVATENGLANFDPARLLPERHAPVPYVLGVVSDGQEYRPPGPGSERGILELPAGSGRRIEVTFGAIQLHDPDRVRFRYRLEGEDEKWSPPSDHRKAVYNDLKPGEYRFLLEASGTQHQFRADPKPLTIKIRPYLWETVTFKAAGALCLVGLGLVAHFRGLARHRRIQQRLHHEKLLAEKARIAADMHDDLGAALTRIAILGEVAQRQEPETADHRRILQRITEAARETTTAISDLVWATDPNQDTVASLVSRLRERAAQQLEDTGIELKTDLPHLLPDRHISALARRNLLLILKEALNNVAKHSSASVVALHLGTMPNQLFLTISDDGRGPTKAPNGRTGNGLANMRRRATEMGGSFGIRETPGSGFTVEIMVPMK